MKGLYADVRSLQSALEQAPEVFQPVCMHLSINVTLGMVNDLVREVLLLQSLIGHERIGVDRALCLYVSADVALYCVFLAIRNHHHADLPATFQDTHNSRLV